MHHKVQPAASPSPYLPESADVPAELLPRPKGWSADSAAATEMQNINLSVKNEQRFGLKRHQIAGSLRIQWNLTKYDTV